MSWENSRDTRPLRVRRARLCQQIAPDGPVVRAHVRTGTAPGADWDVAVKRAGSEAVASRWDDVARGNAATFQDAKNYARAVFEATVHAETRAYLGELASARMNKQACHLVSLAVTGGLRPHLGAPWRPGDRRTQIIVDGRRADALFGCIYLTPRGRFHSAYLTHGNSGQERRYDTYAQVRAVLTSWIDPRS